MIRSSSAGHSSDRPGHVAMVRALNLAEQLLTRRHGATVTLADPEDLGGSEHSVVLRARVAATPFQLPRALVVKHYPRDAGGEQVGRFNHEAASSQLFTALPVHCRPSPELVAHDPANRLLVLEDLGRCASLADKLFDHDAAAAERYLISWARALGKMHAVTAGREKDFYALLRRLGERSWRDPMADEARAALATVPEMVNTTLGIAVSATALAEATAGVRLLGGTRYRAFSPSDACPDNNLVTSKGVRFVDFEGGCFRDVVLDAAYALVPFPGCASSFALPAGMPEAMIAAWRAEIVGVWPDLDDHARLARRLLDAQLLWVWLCTVWLLPKGLARNAPLGPDPTRSPGALTALTHYWSRLAKDAETGGLHATVELANAIVVALGRRTVDGPAELPLYPAFARSEAS